MSDVMAKRWVAVSSTGGDLRSNVDPRFGRCPFFVLVDLDTMNFSATPNPAGAAAGGAGVEAAQTVLDMGVLTVLTGSIGPNAFRTLNAAGVRVYPGATGTVLETVERFRSGDMKEVGEATVPDHFGMGGGRGRGSRGGRSGSGGRAR
jgi:predicted Fe-Mo cluster-binding NifX family protein